KSVQALVSVARLENFISVGGFLVVKNRGNRGFWGIVLFASRFFPVFASRMSIGRLAFRKNRLSGPRNPRFPRFFTDGSGEQMDNCCFLATEHAAICQLAGLLARQESLFVKPLSQCGPGYR